MFSEMYSQIIFLVSLTNGIITLSLSWIRTHLETFLVNMVTPLHVDDQTTLPTQSLAQPGFCPITLRQSHYLTDIVTLSPPTVIVCYLIYTAQGSPFRYQILQTTTMRVVWHTERRIINEILGVQELKGILNQYRSQYKILRSKIIKFHHGRQKGIRDVINSLLFWCLYHPFQLVKVTEHI